MASSSDRLSLINLPEDIIFKILPYLSVKDCLNVGSVHTRLRDFFVENKLLKNIDIRDSTITPNELFSYKNLFTRHVESICIRLNGEIIKRSLGLKLKTCTNLCILVLEQLTIDKEDLLLKSLPRKLKELSLKNSNILDAKFFFWNADKNLPELHTLILDGCNWIESIHFIHILGISLKNLSVRLQNPISFTFVPLNMFTTSTLRRLDITLQENEMNDVESFLGLENLVELYLEKLRPNEPLRDVFRHVPIKSSLDPNDNVLFTNRYGPCAGMPDYNTISVHGHFINFQTVGSCFSAPSSLERLIVRNINLDKLINFAIERCKPGLKILNLNDEGVSELQIHRRSNIHNEIIVLNPWRCKCSLTRDELQ